MRLPDVCSTSSIGKAGLDSRSTFKRTSGVTLPTFPIVLVHGIARFDILAEVLRTKLQIPESPLAIWTCRFKEVTSQAGLDTAVTDTKSSGKTLAPSRS